MARKFYEILAHAPDDMGEGEGASMDVGGVKTSAGGT